MADTQRRPPPVSAAAREGRYTLRMKTDPLFYRLFQERPDTAFELIGETAPPGCRYRLRAEELKQTAHRLDGILLPECDRPDAPLIFVEAQFYPDADFYRRWLSAIFLYIHRHKIDGSWLALAVFPGRGTDIAAATPFEGLIRIGLLHRVYLEDLLDDHPVAERPLGQRLARLIAIERAGAASEARTLIAAVQEAEPAIAERLVDLIETIVIYKLPELSREEIQTMLDLPPTTDVTKIRFYRDAYRDGEIAGEQRGEQRGEKRGKQRGEQNEALKLVRRLLRRRLGTPSDAHEAMLAALPTARLEDLSEALLDFASTADLDAWLATRESTRD